MYLVNINYKMKTLTQLLFHYMTTLVRKKQYQSKQMKQVIKTFSNKKINEFKLEN